MQYDLKIEGHKIVALGFNEDKPGTPVIFIHGIGSSIQFWAGAQTPIIEDQFRWYSLSLPGHYPAVLPADFQREDLTPETIARVLARAIRELVGDTPAMLVGHSTGGFAALAIAALYPEQVCSVICVGGFAQGTWNGILRPYQMEARMGKVGDAMFKMGFGSLKLSSAMFRQIGSLYAHDRKAYFAFPTLDESMKRLFGDFQKLDLDAMLYYFGQMPDIDITKLLPRVRVPTLVIAGDRDGIVPASQASVIASGVPDSTLVLLRGAGHMVMMERSEEYEQLVTEWAEQYQYDAYELA